MFYPPINYYFSQFVHHAGDLRNIALVALGAYTLKNMMKSKM